MSREISLAHSRSILDRQRHVMSIGLENQALFHYDINSNDALDRYQLGTSILSPLKWEFISGSSDNVTVNNDGSILITGVTGSFIIVGADYIEIQPDPKYYLSLIMMNINDSDESHTVSVGTINYTDLDTKITQGRPSGIDYDNWVIDGDSINFDDSGNNVIQWHTYVNNAIMIQEYKSGESGTPTELHKWPSGIKYARIFIKITNLVPADQIMIRDLNMFFKDDDGTYTNITPSHTVIDSFDGKFGGGMDMSGGGINLVWNGDLRYGATNWSVGTQGSGSVTASLDDDGSYKVYFREVQDVKNIIQIDMPQDIVDSTEYTISFYARAAVPIGFRRISVIDPVTQNVGWVAEKIIYIDNTWRKFTATATSDFATGAMSRLVITEPDLLEPETLFIYYNGVLLTRGTDYVELDDYNLQFDFDTSADDNDVISIYSQISSSFVSSSYRIIFHSAVPAGNTVAIRHFTEVADPTVVTAMEEMYEISSPTTTVDTGNYVPDTPNYLHVFRNGQLLVETVDYITSVVVGIIRLSFSYSLVVGDSIKVVFWKNMSMLRNDYTAVGSLDEQFDLPAGTYTTDAAHMMVFENGILLTEGALNDYIEFDTNTIQYNGTPGAGNTISLISIADTYEFGIDSWVLLSNQIQFAYTPEDTNVFRFVTVNGTAMSKDYSVWINDYYEPIASAGDSFYYERYDLPAVAIPSQTVFPVPGGYDVGDDLQVYRNGILLTLTDDYTKQQPAGTVTLIVPAVVGELMTIFRIITEPGAGPSPTRYVREDYTLDEGMPSYNTSQVFAVGDDSLQIFINGVLQRLGLDYTEDDTNTITLLSPFSTGDTIAFLISLPLGSEQASEYSQVTYHGTDVDADNILYTPAVTLNYVEDTEGTVWIKNVKLGEGKPYTDSYHTGTIISGNLEYDINIDELEGTITFQMKPYAIDLEAEGIINWQGEVDNYAALPVLSPDWTARANPVDNDWQSVTYGNGLFVAVAASGPAATRVMTSSNGVNWTSREAAAPYSWLSVTYGDGLFVAVGMTSVGKRVMTSPNGIDWTIRSSAADNTWTSVTYGNELFVAVAYSAIGNGVMTSSNGIDWATQTSAADNNWSSVVYANGLFVAVATSGLGNRVMTSSNGIDWDIQTSAANNDWNSVTYGDGLFVAVPRSGSGNKVMTSPNGINWTIRTSAADYDWRSVTYGNGLFVAVGDSGTGDRSMTSTNGKDWALGTSAADNTWHSVTYGNGLFVAVAYSGFENRIMTRSDASPGAMYRTKDTYKYWEWDGSSYDEILGPTVFSLLYGGSWDLFKIERVLGETNKFKAIVGEPNNYSVITIPELSIDDWTMITVSWSQFGTQWYQTKYDTYASLPVLTSSEEGYVYKVSDTGYYYIWDGDSWEPKAPDGAYSKYTDLPTYTLFEDGYAAYVDEEPELYQGSVANYASLPVGHSVTEQGWIYKTTDTGYYYIWDWDYVEDTGNWRKIIPGYYYQWSWNPSTQSGSWGQSNKIKLYLNGGADGIYTKSYHPVSNQPDGLVITNKLYGKVDELRIDRIARDPKEIAAWNNSQAPFYPSGDVAQIV